MGKKSNSESNIDKICQYCNNCIYIGEGVFYCDYGEPIYVLEDWCPANDYLWCGGKYFEKQ